MYFRRKIDKFLLDWKRDTDRKPLLVKGARQVGKSESIRHFAFEKYSNVIEINFLSQPQFKRILDNGYETDAVIKAITLLMPEVRFTAGETLLFFDEIQDFPDIATTLKFFKIDGRYDVICSGSMLGINYKSIHSHSVGYKTDYQMYSMDFEEFLWAKGYTDEFIEEMAQHIKERKPFDNLQHDRMVDLFRDYCVVGGMPEIVKTYIEKESFEGILPRQRQLLLEYGDDVRKYTEGIEQTRILNVFNHIPVQLAKENKKFQISKVAKNAKSKDYWGCIEWLADAGIIDICYCLNFPELPLKGNYDESKFKLYYADIGLLIASLDDEAQYDLRANRNLGTYKGAIYENIVADELKKNGSDLFYYKREDSTLEEDFFLRTGNELVPVEVKSKKGSSASLRALITGEKYKDITWGIKLSMNNIGFANSIYTVPYYCAFLLKRYMLWLTSPKSPSTVS